MVKVLHFTQPSSGICVAWQCALGLLWCDSVCQSVSAGGWQWTEEHTEPPSEQREGEAAAGVRQ